MRFLSEELVREIQVMIHLIEDVDTLNDDAKLWVSGRLHVLKELLDSSEAENFLREIKARNSNR